MLGSNLVPGKWDALIGQIQVTGPTLSLEEGAGLLKAGVFTHSYCRGSPSDRSRLVSGLPTSREQFFFLRFKGLNKNKKSMLQRLCGL